MNWKTTYQQKISYNQPSNHLIPLFYSIQNHYHAPIMKEITSINPLSITKAAAALGSLWGILGWFVGSVLVLLIRLFSADVDPATIPPAFSIIDLLGYLLSGTIGGAISGYLGSLVYNQFAKKFGGIVIQIDDARARGGKDDDNEDE